MGEQTAYRLLAALLLLAAAVDFTDARTVHEGRLLSKLAPRLSFKQ
jgi:hypothetical protein